MTEDADIMQKRSDELRTILHDLDLAEDDERPVDWEASPSVRVQRLLAELASLRRLEANLRRLSFAWRRYQTVRFRYKNYRGETAERTALILSSPHFGKNEWHTEQQWLVDARDIDKQDTRSFAVAGILEWIEEPEAKEQP